MTHHCCLPGSRATFFVLILVFASSVARGASSDSFVTFSIPSGGAVASLKQFSAQSGQQVIYSNADLAGVTTNEVKGSFTVSAALERLLAGTPLVPSRDSRNGAVAVARADAGGSLPKARRAAQVSDRPDSNSPSTSTRASPSGTGAIRGTVSNQGTNQFLYLATIRLAGSDLETTTDRDGSYRFAGIPAGTLELVATYAGLEPQRLTVTVVAQETAVADFGLSDGITQLGKFVVVSEREGFSAAISAKQRSESLVSVASTDGFGDAIYGNSGDFLKNLPGLQINNEGLDARQITLRGMPPSLTLVTMDGNQVASAASTAATRTFEIDQLSIANIERIEVFKAPVPSMPANAIGGTVNLVTKNAFSQKGRRASVTLTAAFNSQALTLSRTVGPQKERSRKINPGITVSYSDTLLGGRLGVALNVSLTKVWFPYANADNLMVYSGTLPVFPNPYMRETPARRRDFAHGVNQQTNDRNGYSLNLDYKLSNSTVLYLRSSFTDYATFNRRFGVTLRSLAVAPGFTATDLEALPTTSVAGVISSFFEKQSRTLTLVPGVRFKSGPWRIDLDNQFSRSSNDYRFPDFFGGINMQVVGVGFRMSTPEGTVLPSTLTQTAGPSWSDALNYTPVATNFVSNNRRNSDDTVISSKFDVRRDIEGRFPAYVKVGGSYQFQRRIRNNPQRRWNYTGPTDRGTIGRFVDDTGRVLKHQVAPMPQPGLHSAWKIYDYYSAHPEYFPEDLAYAYEQNFLGTKLHESLYAGYAMGKVSFGKFDVLTGARVETTDDVGTGPLQQPSRVPVGINVNSLEGMRAKYSRTTTRSRSTPDPFKYLHLTYRVLPDLQGRVSYTEAIGRPDFSNIFPNTTINDSSRTVVLNNSELKPQRAQNIDLSLEYYFKPAGTFSASWFTKDIEDYISTSSSTIAESIPNLGIGDDLIGYTLNTSINFGSAKWEGIELDYRLQLARFRSLPAALRGLELFANYTHIYKMEGNFGGTFRIDRLSNVSSRLYNLGFSYTAFRSTLYFDLKGTYQSAYLLANTGTNAQLGTQRDPYLRWDTSLRYRFSPQSRYQIIVTGRNIFDRVHTQSELGRTTRWFDDAGAWYSAALSISL